MDQQSHELGNIYENQGNKILKFLLKRSGGNKEVAESVLQDTFLAAAKSFSAFRHKSTYFTWLCKIALNKLADYYRDQVHRSSRIVIPTIEQFNNLVDPAISPEEKAVLEDLKVQVNKCLDLLPSQYRQLLHFKYYLDLSSKEICLKLNLSPRQLEGRLYRARTAFAKLFH